MAAPKGPVPIVARRDRAARIRYSTTTESTRAAIRFSEFQRAMLGARTLSPGARVAGCLIAFELILSRSELIALIDRLPAGVYRTASSDKLLLDWNWGAGWMDRRILSPHTALALQGSVAPLSAEVILAELAALIRCVIP